MEVASIWIKQLKNWCKYVYFGEMQIFIDSLNVIERYDCEGQRRIATKPYGYGVKQIEKIN